MPSSLASSRVENNLIRRKQIARIRGGSSEFTEVEKTAQPQEENPILPSVVAPQQPPTMSEVAPPDATPITETIVAPANEPLSTEIINLLGPNAKAAGSIRRAFPSFPWHNLPNYLTLMRCAAIPMFVYTFYQPGQHIPTSLLFAFASLTDWFDGFLARRWDISSPFGAFLDPVADKLMVSTSLILLTGRYGAKMAIPTSIILAREIAVSALREWMATRGARDTVKVGMQGKVKTALTMTALTLLLAVPENGVGTLGKLLFPAELMLYASALITVTSGSVYFRAAAPVLLSSNKK
jgi:CDP-diacylglycerol--glycerol-3-phosphate 3-phosphatidyltransferase